MNIKELPGQKWTARHRGIMALLVATGGLVAAVQVSCLPPLFKEISEDLGLDVVEIGSIWGFSNLAGIVVAIIGGVLVDRFGVRRVLIITCILTGITGALRGLADNFTILTVTVILNGAVRLIIPVAATSSIALWFKGPRLGLAMGISAMGMGLGLMLGTLLSATVLSPWLGGWRNVLFVLGGIAVFVGLLWLFFGKPPGTTPEKKNPAVPLMQGLKELVHVRAIWIIGLILLFRSGCMTGINGYVPYYLREIGWSEAAADGTLSAFFAASTICVIPLAYLSDRLGSRKAIMVPAVVVATICVGLLPLLEGAGVWAIMIITGMFMDGFMSLTTTITAEAEGVKPAYAGIAFGMVLTFGNIGGVVAPPLGNALATTAQPGMPFFFWAGLSAISLILLLLYRPKR